MLYSNLPIVKVSKFHIFRNKAIMHFLAFLVSLEHHCKSTNIISFYKIILNL